MTDHRSINAVAENFFATLKAELLHTETWNTHQQARTAILEHIEVFYNRQRRESARSYLSPTEFERRYYLLPSAANRPVYQSGQLHCGCRRRSVNKS